MASASEYQRRGRDLSSRRPRASGSLPPSAPGSWVDAAVHAGLAGQRGHPRRGAAKWNSRGQGARRTPSAAAHGSNGRDDSAAERPHGSTVRAGADAPRPNAFAGNRGLRRRSTRLRHPRLFHCAAPRLRNRRRHPRRARGSTRPSTPGSRVNAAIRAAERRNGIAVGKARGVCRAPLPTVQRKRRFGRGAAARIHGPRRCGRSAAECICRQPGAPSALDAPPSPPAIPLRRSAASESAPPSGPRSRVDAAVRAAFRGRRGRPRRARGSTPPFAPRSGEME